MGGGARALKVAKRLASIGQRGDALSLRFVNGAARGSSGFFFSGHDPIITAASTFSRGPPWNLGPRRFARLPKWTLLRETADRHPCSVAPPPLPCDHPLRIPIVRLPKCSV